MSAADSSQDMCFSLEKKKWNKQKSEKRFKVAAGAGRFVDVDEGDWLIFKVGGELVGKFPDEMFKSMFIEVKDDKDNVQGAAGMATPEVIAAPDH